MMVARKQIRDSINLIRKIIYPLFHLSSSKIYSYRLCSPRLETIRSPSVIPGSRERRYIPSGTTPDKARCTPWLNPKVDLSRDRALNPNVRVHDSLAYGTQEIPPHRGTYPPLFTTESYEISFIINSNAETFSALLVRERCWFIHAKYEKYERDHVRSVSFRVLRLKNDS